jgi:hypothetical protein
MGANDVDCNDDDDDDDDDDNDAAADDDDNYYYIKIMCLIFTKVKVNVVLMF